MKIFGKNVAHWTPRYVLNRGSLALFQRRNPDAPWLTPDAIRMLDTLLKKSDAGMEWGSGRSTCWLAKRVRHITSVEDNPEWYERVRRDLQTRGLTNVDYHLTAVPDENDGARSDYVRAADRHADGSLGFALVDGSARDHCVRAVMPKLAPGGVLIVDNANWYFDHPTHAPASRYGLGPATQEWKAIAEELGAWRSLWTTQGVWDTAIWIKPARA